MKSSSPAKEQRNYQPVTVCLIPFSVMDDWVWISHTPAMYDTRYLRVHAGNPKAASFWFKTFGSMIGVIFPAGADMDM